MFMQACARAPWTPVVARVLLALVFVVAGYNKLTGFESTVGFIGGMTNESVAPLLTVLAIIFELGGGLMLLFNWKTEHAVSMLIVFTIIATILAHTDFSNPATQQMQLSAFLKNLALIGGLLLMGRLACTEEPKTTTTTA